MPPPPFALLINPDTGVRNSISLGYIAAYARSRGFDCDVLDFCSDQPSPASLKELLRRRQPGLVGVAAYQATMRQVLDACRFVKENSDAKIILGGCQVPGMPDRGFAALKDADYLCRGEGELVFSALLEALRFGRGPETVPGISYRGRESEIITTRSPREPGDLDVYPSPYVSGVLPARPGMTAEIFTSRGCPHDCAFCVTPELSGRRLRFFSIRRVITELRYLRAKGVHDIWIADPLFASGRSRVKELLSAITAARLGMKFWCQFRADFADQECLALMKKAGVATVALGLESTSPEALRLMNKRQDMGVFDRTVGAIQRQGIRVEFLQMVGAPGDTPASVLRSLDYVRSRGSLLEENSYPNSYSLYFSSAASGDPAKHGITLKRSVRSSGYPPYLSPGTAFHTPSMSPRGRRLVSQRLAAENLLAATISAARLLEKSCGIPGGQALAFAPHYMQALNFFLPEKSRSLGTEPAYDLLVLGYPGNCAQEPRPLKAAGPLSLLAFRAALLVHNQEREFFFESGFQEQLVSAFAPSSLYSRTLLLALNEEQYGRRLPEIAAALGRLRGTAERIAATGHGAQVNAAVLLDLSRSAEFPSSYRRLAAEAANAGAALFPYFVFGRGASAGQYLRLFGGEPARQQLKGTPVAVMATPAVFASLGRIYRRCVKGRTLPPAVSLNGGMLFPGAEPLLPGGDHAPPLRCLHGGGLPGEEARS